LHDQGRLCTLTITRSLLNTTSYTKSQSHMGFVHFRVQLPADST